MELELEKNNKQNYNQIIEKSVNNNLENNNTVANYIATAENQNRFLETTLGKTVNTALDVGLRYLLPDVVEDQIIEIKDTIIEKGFKEGLDKTIESAVNLGKSAIGIVTGKFDNVSQIRAAVAKGGLLDTISGGIDFGLEVANKSGLISNGVESLIKKGKNVLLNNIESNIENTLEEQVNAIEKIDKYIDNWTGYYNEQNFDKMELEYDKIQEKLKELVPIETTLQKAHMVENLHKLIKNNGKSFDLSLEEIELARKLT